MSILSCLSFKIRLVNLGIKFPLYYEFIHRKSLVQCYNNENYSQICRLTEDIWGRVLSPGERKRFCIWVSLEETIGDYRVVCGPIEDYMRICGPIGNSEIEYEEVIVMYLCLVNHHRHSIVNNWLYLLVIILIL